MGSELQSRGCCGRAGVERSIEWMNCMDMMDMAIRESRETVRILWRSFKKWTEMLER
jgi:hypothetical protein